MGCHFRILQQHVTEWFPYFLGFHGAFIDDAMGRLFSCIFSQFKHDFFRHNQPAIGIQIAKHIVLANHQPLQQRLGHSQLG